MCQVGQVGSLSSSGTFLPVRGIRKTENKKRGIFYFSSGQQRPISTLSAASVSSTSAELT